MKFLNSSDSSSQWFPGTGFVGKKQLPWESGHPKPKTRTGLSLPSPPTKRQRVINNPSTNHDQQTPTLHVVYIAPNPAQPPRLGIESLDQDGRHPLSISIHPGRPLPLPTMARPYTPFGIPQGQGACHVGQEAALGQLAACHGTVEHLQRGSVHVDRLIEHAPAGRRRPVSAVIAEDPDQR